VVLKDLDFINAKRKLLLGARAARGRRRRGRLRR